MSSPPKRIAGFFVTFLVVYALLAIPWPPVRSGYRAFYCWLGNLTFGSLGETGSVRFAPWGERHQAYDVKLVLSNARSPGDLGEMHNNSINIGYYPTVIIVALVVATPVSWRWRRLRALLWCLLWVHVFVLFRMAIPIIRELSKPTVLQVFHPGPVALRILLQADIAFVKAPASFFVMPIVIWILVTFRRGDLQSFLSGGREPQEEKDRLPREPGTTDN
ncbi:MAG: hypothetical protein JSV78_12315 [Phycisphaerales bacterium]|nr:MAG: hypothetical protein JSV78_12315 [Phycisphaerales bacterium]